MGYPAACRREAIFSARRPVRSERMLIQQCLIERACRQRLPVVYVESRASRRASRMNSVGQALAGLRDALLNSLDGSPGLGASTRSHGLAGSFDHRSKSCSGSPFSHSPLEKSGQLSGGLLR